METKELSIIIVNYNGKHYLKDCIDSIIFHCSSISYEIIIVDNNSSDGSIEYLQSNFPQVRLLTKTENLGFGKANNVGVRNSIGENILLLNNDTILLHNLTTAIEELNNEGVGIVGIKMLDKEKQYRKSAGKFPTLLSLTFFSKLFINKNEFSTGNFNQRTYEVDWIEASLLLTKRAYYDKIKGFSEDYFMYVEDVDFCKKMALCGKKTVYFPEVSYIHFGGFNKTKQSLLIEGYKIYIRKYFNSLKIVGILILNFKKKQFRSIQ